MQKLVKGVHQFQKDVFSSNKALYEKLASGQSPETLFICCSDSRVNPTELVQAAPGELFVIQNAGNLIPPYIETSGGVTATIEYAVMALKVKDIVVCGHSQCGAMTGLLNLPQLANMPAVVRWLGNAESTRRIISENYRHITDEAARLTATVEENVLVQLENLRTHPSIAAALSRHDLHLHGWVYKFETGDVFAYDPESGQFDPLGKVDRAAVSGDRRG